MDALGNPLKFIVTSGAAGDNPQAIPLLAGQRAPTPQAIALAASHAADGVDPLSDIHASAVFRAHLAEVNTRRAIERALSRG